MLGSIWADVRQFARQRCLAASQRLCVIAFLSESAAPPLRDNEQFQGRICDLSTRRACRRAALFAPVVASTSFSGPGDEMRDRTNGRPTSESNPRTCEWAMLRKKQAELPRAIELCFIAATRKGVVMTARCERHSGKAISFIPGLCSSSKPFIPKTEISWNEDSVFGRCPQAARTGNASDEKDFTKIGLTEAIAWTFAPHCGNTQVACGADLQIGKAPRRSPIVQGGDDVRSQADQ